ncbi:nuclear transport factor 2 family protein [Aeromicrobium wangtongii]|uniref:nuclear transport factor 2 family protein n=1 Tax=Aeromicrobium wangtongii TaxID=2969247 RepID=UPI00201710E1|nr:nuclear transport factor 2 family protein [Aeromicrobium wangtongii]MCL3820342.1 nuclear transport factor 2 family protein [Aeromicrobium wangtongii]
MTDPLDRWHEIVRTQDASLIGPLLADDVVFRSPAVHTPQEGRPVVTAYLTAALTVLGPGLTYHRQWREPSSAVLEFTTQIDGIDVHGVDVIEWDDESRIVDFTVMVRPVKGLQILIERMGAELMRAQA